MIRAHEMIESCMENLTRIRDRLTQEQFETIYDPLQQLSRVASAGALGLGHENLPEGIRIDNHSTDSVLNFHAPRIRHVVGMYNYILAYSILNFLQVKVSRYLVIVILSTFMFHGLDNMAGPSSPLPPLIPFNFYQV